MVSQSSGTSQEKTPIKSENRPTLVSIILNWNSYDVARTFIASLSRTPLEGHEIVIVDNDSPNKATQKIESEFPTYTYIYNKENVGIAAGNNVAIRYALEKGARYVFLFNFDLEIIEEDFFKKMISYMDAHPDVGMLAPALMNPDGSPQSSVKPLPTLWNQFYFEWFFLKRLLRRLGLRAKKRVEGIRDVDFVMASAVLVRRETIEDIGLQDERFFLGYEDMDWCKRANDAGWKVRYFPETHIVHRHGAASKQLMTNFDFYFKEKLRFFMKHHSVLYVFFFRVFVSIGALARALFGRLLWLFTGQKERKAYAQAYQRLAYRILLYPWHKSPYLIPQRPTPSL